jgi:hypothetical protein
MKRPYAGWNYLKKPNIQGKIVTLICTFTGKS